MQNPLVLELLFVTVAVLVGISDSFKCYQCRSDTDDGCNSHVNISWSKDCESSTNKVYCRKISQKLKFKNEKSWTSIRECAYEKQGPSCYSYEWLEIAYQNTCECEEENCNRGTSQAPEKLMVTLIAFAWMLSYLKSNIT